MEHTDVVLWQAIDAALPRQSSLCEHVTPSSNRGGHVSGVGYFGVACIAAAIIGGGLKWAGAEIPLIRSVRRQVLLAAFGCALVAADGGLNRRGAGDGSGVSEPRTPTTTSQQAAGSEPVNATRVMPEPPFDPVEHRILELVTEQLGRDARVQSTYDDLGADDLDLTELAQALEREFRMEIPDRDWEPLKKSPIEQTVLYVKRRLRR